MIKWFTSIPDKENTKFLQFDIDDYYASITEPLIVKPLIFSKTITTVSDMDVDIILHARRTVVVYDKSLWINKNSDAPFDVGMGANDSAEVSDLVGLFLLHNLGTYFTNIGG